MDTTIPPLEPVETGHRPSVVRGDALVAAAWADHHAELYAFLVRSTRDPLAAEDLLGETYLRLTAEVRADRAPDNVRAWLYRVATNLATSRGRHLRSAVRWLDTTGRRLARSEPDDPPETNVIAAEGRSELGLALADLVPDARAALLLAAEGFSGVEIAALIGRSEAATRTLMCRARLVLRHRLARAEVVP